MVARSQANSFWTYFTLSISLAFMQRKMAKISTSQSKVMTAYKQQKRRMIFAHTYNDIANIYTHTHLAGDMKKEHIMNRNVHIFKRTKSIHT